MSNLLPPGELVEPFADRHSSASECAELARRRARALTGLGVGAGDRVLVHYGNTIDFFVDLLAVWSVGGCAVPLDPRLSALELRAIGGAARASLSLWEGAAPPAADALRDVGTRVLDAAAIREERQACEGTAVPLDADALILFTSGTTGIPKGVVHTHRGLQTRWRAQRARSGEGTLLRTLCLLPTNFAWGLAGNALYAWLGGNALYLAPAFRSDVLLRSAEICDRHSITYFPTVPSMWRTLVRMAAPPSRGTLQRIACGSGPLPASLWSEVRRWSGVADVTNVYSMSECGAIASHSIADGAPEEGLVGAPFDGVEIRIARIGADVADQDARCPTGESGAVWVRTPTLMRGYFQRDDLTAEVVREGWFRTGDVGAVDDRGRLHLRGRDKDMINVGGVKVYPADVDGVVEKSGTVLDVCTFPMPDALQGEQVAIAVVLDPARDATLDEVYRWTLSHVAPFQLPKRWYVLDALPRTGPGKLNRKAVADACASAESVDVRALQNRAAAATSR